VNKRPLFDQFVNMLPHRDSVDRTDSISDSSDERIARQIPEVVLKDAEIVTEKGHVVTKDGVLISTNESDSIVNSNPFSDPEIKAYYVNLYEKSQYECRHVFDADLTWTEDEEKKLVRKLDWRGM
jgi:hypothetical protein